MSENINNEELAEVTIPQATKPIILGKYKMPGVIGFSSVQGNIKINTDEAFIDGKFLSGMLDHLKFKMTIRDDETVDLDEVDTEETDEAMRGRLLEKFYDAELKIGKLGGMYNPSDFEFTSTVESKLNNKFISLVLLATAKRPIDNLADLLYGGDLVKVSPSTRSSISDLLDEFEEHPTSKSHDTEKNDVEEALIESKPMVTQDSALNHLKVTKEELIESGAIHRDELGQAIIHTNEQVTAELKKIQAQKVQDNKNSESRIIKNQKEIDELQKRIDLMAAAPVKNGMLFSISEALEDSSDDYIFDPEVIKVIKSKVSGLKEINADAFMNLFKNGKYIITIGDNNGEMLTESSDNIVLPSGTSLKEGKFIYLGDLEWHDLVSEMIQLGYSQDSDFEKKAGSNSYNTNSRLDSPKDTPLNEAVSDKLLDMITLPANNEPGQLKVSKVNIWGNLYEKIKNLFK